MNGKSMASTKVLDLLRPALLEHCNNSNRALRRVELLKKNVDILQPWNILG